MKKPPLDPTPWYAQLMLPTDPPRPCPRLLSTWEAAAYLRFESAENAERTLGRYVRLGQLRTVKLGRCHFYPVEELERFVRQRFAEQNGTGLPDALTMKG